MITTVCRVILGVTFLFSGFTKCIDPQGFAYSLNEYLYAFGLGSLTNLSIIPAVIITLLEFSTGLSLLLKYQLKKGINIAFLFMFIFTGLTFVLAITNIVEDCGCFGSTIKLSNWETFAKNAILLIPAIHLFRIRKRLPEIKSVRVTIKFILLLLTGYVVLGYSYATQPLIDMPKYAVGARIEPILHTDPSGIALIQVVPQLSKVPTGIQDDFNKLYIYCNERGFDFQAYTSSSQEERIDYMRNNRMPYELRIADEMSLKNLMRPEAGLVAVSDGVIIGKWSYRNMPQIKNFEKSGVVGVAMQQQTDTRHKLIIAVALLMLLLFLKGNGKTIANY